MAFVGMTFSLRAQDYLTFTAEEDSVTIQFNGPSCEYRLSEQTTWIHNDGDVITLVNAGNQVQFRCELDEPLTTYSTALEPYTFKIAGKVAASGNIMSLMDKTCRKTSLKGAERAFYEMFRDCKGLTSAPKLPATTLESFCYASMFNGCRNLKSAPELPATTLAEHCYRYMFSRCTGLTSAPALPATRLAGYCYLFMFHGCTGLTGAPALPAMTLAEHCYRSMFYDCTNLKSVPLLPATTLANACYRTMFDGCKSLVINYFPPGTEWGIPVNAITPDDSSWNSLMLSGTGGDYEGNPKPGAVYYVASDQTGIEATFEDIELGSDAIFNLYGQQVGADATGFQIQNGKKVLKK